MMTLALVVAGSVIVAGSAVSGPLDALSSVYTVTTSAGSQGAAFAVRRDVMMTAAHVVEGVDVVRLEGTQTPPLRREATVRFRDETVDLAVLQLTEPLPDSAPVLRWRANAVVGGLEVFAVGSPIDGVVLSRGEVVIPDQDGWIVASSPVDPGNSGGPLLDKSGDIVGVVVAQSEFSGEAYVVPASTGVGALASADALPTSSTQEDVTTESGTWPYVSLIALALALLALALSIFAVVVSLSHRRRRNTPPLTITLD